MILFQINRAIEFLLCTEVFQCNALFNPTLSDSIIFACLNLTVVQLCFFITEDDFPFVKVVLIFVSSILNEDAGVL